MASWKKFNEIGFLVMRSHPQPSHQLKIAQFEICFSTTRRGLLNKSQNCIGLEVERSPPQTQNLPS
ncbi:hypothetical protein I8748_17015 [Nostoc sp. CENA67]|uniref:Uncharacterized protein n=1 Tax=Amazonocrinis nigriterrae CENA67 TaxID=2794033 RepID=A0A8J7LAB0_9NOST|nr:hypothetical protein [Amazonocrinis nigriterrae]MBH8563866.1 hypothetical protein [Amazonocrinis nigriterrae CENA67]